MLKTSTYHKIQDIIEAAGNHTGGVKELAESIQGQYESFVYYKRDANGTVEEYPCDTATIRRTIRFCIDLDLLVSEEDCTPTDKGKRALDRSRFDFQLQQAVLAYLENNNLPWSKIEAAIDKIALPIFRSLYQELSPEISENSFRACLHLLTVCEETSGRNILKPFQKKLYLTDARLDETKS